MRRDFKPLLLVAGISLATASQAITFSNFTINGSPAASGRISFIGSNGLSFSIPEHFLLGVGSMTMTVGYRVNASPGNLLTGFTAAPVGNSKLGSVSIGNAHSNGGTEFSNYLVTGGSSLITLPNQNYSLSGTKAFYDVLATITLTGNEPTSINKVTVYTAMYNQAVPEPASLAALGLGVVALIRRKRGSR